MKGAASGSELLVTCHYGINCKGWCSGSLACSGNRSTELDCWTSVGNLDVQVSSSEASLCSGDSASALLMCCYRIGYCCDCKRAGSERFMRCSRQRSLTCSASMLMSPRSIKYCLLPSKITGSRRWPRIGSPVFVFMNDSTMVSNGRPGLMLSMTIVCCGASAGNKLLLWLKQTSVEQSFVLTLVLCIVHCCK